MFVGFASENSNVIPTSGSISYSPDDPTEGVIWGANCYVLRSQAQNYVSDTVFQYAAECGLTHLLFWQYPFNQGAPRIFTTSQWVSVVDRMKVYGLKPIFDLEYNVDEAVALVTALGNDCMMYEVGKEPHVSGTAATADPDTYVTYWNEIVTACRQVNPNAMYGGPGVGSMPNTSPRSETWMREWLQRCDGDFVSVHAFYDPISSQSDVISRARTDTIEDIVFLKNLMAEYGKEDLPIVFSEVQWTSSVTTNGWDYDESFIRPWTQNLMATMEEYGVHSVFFWVFMGYDTNLDLIRPPSQNYERKPQYYAIQDYLMS